MSNEFCVSFLIEFLYVEKKLKKVLCLFGRFSFSVNVNICKSYNRSLAEAFLYLWISWSITCVFFGGVSFKVWLSEELEGLVRGLLIKSSLMFKLDILSDFRSPSFFETQRENFL